MERDAIKSTAPVPFDDDDKESFLDEAHSSPDSSPDRQIGSRTRLVPAIKTVAVPSEGETSKGEREEGEGATKDEGAVPKGDRKDNLAETEDVKTSDSDYGEGIGSDRESTTATPPSSRSPSVGASTTTISSSDNAPEPNFSQ